MELEEPTRPQSRPGKFRNAIRGVKLGMRGESSFFVHLFAAAMVVATGLVLGLSVVEWAVLVLTIVVVFVAEMLNTAIEYLVRGITRDHHPQLGKALDIASGAVLCAAIGSVVVGLLVLGARLAELLGWRTGP